MNRSCCPAFFLVLAALSDAGATTNLFVNSTPVTPGMIPPQIDARAWFNRALFDVTTFNSFQPIPYESQNTLFFTNAPAPAGTMNGDPGFRFFENVGAQRFWMDTWENRGTITTDHNTFFGTIGLFISDSQASILQVAATNITSTGPLLSSGAHGLIRLEGRKINLTRNALRTGPPQVPTIFFGGGFIGLSNYINDFGVSDLYWASGTNNATDNRGGAMTIDGSGTRPSFKPPTPSSPFHDVIYPSGFGRFFTNSTSIPGFFFVGTNAIGTDFFTSGWGVAVNTNALSPSNSVVQVVFYPTNINDPEASIDVRFSAGFGGPFAQPATVVVAFLSTEFDLATQTPSSSAVYLVDALATTTNVNLARNQAVNTRRPTTYELTRNEPIDFSIGLPGNATFNPSLLYNSTFQYRAVTNRYAAYAARVDLLSSSPSGSVPYQATNLPGRIEILGGEVNLDHTRIRAESAVVIRADNLISNQLAQVDAPIVSFDARSTQPVFVITNLAPPTVKRFSGNLRAWSGVWDNADTNAGTSTLFHVLIVDSQLQSIQTVSVNEFAARGTHIVIQDQLNISRSFVVEGDSFHLTGGLQLPFGASLGATNLINVRNFTNDGVINLTGSEAFGTDRPLPYANYVNRGTNIASAHFIRTGNFENPGCLAAQGGLLSIDALSATLLGNPQIEEVGIATNIFFFVGGVFTNISIVTNVLSAAPKLAGVADVELHARDLTVSNSLINAGQLILAVTNRLADSGTGAINHWNVSGGFDFNVLPASSDMFGIHVRSTSPRLSQVDHFCAALDLGATPAGFVNNLALGKLILDGGSNSLFRFFGTGANNALYVDYLELDNFATNYNTTLAIAENFNIYFANASVPATKLDGAVAGRLHWVQDFAGPLSSTNITYFFTNGLVVTSNTYTFNLALVTDKNLDSDFDGIINPDDPTPIFVAQNAELRVSLASQASRAVQLDWTALAYSSNFVEFKSGAAGAWQPLTNFLHGPATSPVRVLDAVPTNGAARVYRLRLDRGPYFN